MTDKQTSRTLKGYALKCQRNVVSYKYPAPHMMRGVQPPLSYQEAKRYDSEAVQRRYRQL